MAKNKLAFIGIIVGVAIASILGTLLISGAFTKTAGSNILAEYTPEERTVLEAAENSLNTMQKTGVVETITYSDGEYTLVYDPDDFNGVKIAAVNEADKSADAASVEGLSAALVKYTYIGGPVARSFGQKITKVSDGVYKLEMDPDNYYIITIKNNLIVGMEMSPELNGLKTTIKYEKYPNVEAVMRAAAASRAQQIAEQQAAANEQVVEETAAP